MKLDLKNKYLVLVFVFIDFLIISLFTFGFFCLVHYEDFQIIPLLENILFSIVVAVLVCCLFLIFKVYFSSFKFFTAFDFAKVWMISFFITCLSSLIVFCFFRSVFNVNWFQFPTILLNSFLVSFLLVIYRLMPSIFIYIKPRFKNEKIRTIVIGAGGAGKVVLDDTIKNDSNRHCILSFLDDNPKKIGCWYCGVKVNGPVSNADFYIKKYKIDEIIIAINNISHERLSEILSYLSSSNVRIRRMPILNELNGPNEIKILNVDFNDLLCREPIILNNFETKNMLSGKTVLVTGAGGSIGSELVRQIFETHPSTLILFDIYENSTYDIQMELVSKIRQENIKDVNVYTLIGSTYNAVRMEQVFKKYRPDFVYHAAAYKHVPLMEDSPQEAIRTNVIGTYNVAKLADKYKTKKMVLVSTDKAVRPTNVMGATKRFAEMIIQYYASTSKNTAYAAVRFGNVLGSNGSVVPLFKKQIESGGPITITNKEIIRYFMTIPEAVSLILQCGLFAKGGEIFILDMGKPVKILDLAERLIKQFGLVPYADIQIIETGLRPGEKLYEELLLDKEKQLKTSNSKIFIEPRAISNRRIDEDIALITKVFDLEETDDIKDLLAKIITSYSFKKVNHGENNQ